MHAANAPYQLLRAVACVIRNVFSRLRDTDSDMRWRLRTYIRPRSPRRAAAPADNLSTANDLDRKFAIYVLRYSFNSSMLLKMCAYERHTENKANLPLPRDV